MQFLGTISDCDDTAKSRSKIIQRVTDVILSWIVVWPLFGHEFEFKDECESERSSWTLDSKHRVQALSNTSHMEALMKIEPVYNIGNINKLRLLYDKIEANVRGLQSIWIDATKYESAFAPFILIKLPQELKTLYLSIIYTIPKKVSAVISRLSNS